MRKIVLFGLVLIVSFCLPACRNETVVATQSAKTVTEERSRIKEVDDALQKTAISELGDRDGAIVIMDARDGRLRAVVNPETAWQQAYQIGSVIKPFVASAMLHDGTLDPNRPFYCPKKIKIGEMSVRCPHPDQRQAITLTRALAISCNLYFATASRRLNLLSLREELQSRGLGRITGLNTANESAGRLEAGGKSMKERASAAIGETDTIMATPLGVATAFLSLITNSPPLTPYIGERANTAHSPGRRDQDEILAGLRGCIEYGTGSDENGWKDLSITVLGKTGSPTVPEVALTRGWFVGASLASDRDSDPELIVVVFLKLGYGRDAAQIAHKIFKAYEEARPYQSAKPAQPEASEQTSSQSNTVTNLEPKSVQRLLVSLFDPIRSTSLTLWSNAALTLRDEATDEVLLRSPGGIHAPRIQIHYLPGGRLRITGANINSTNGESRSLPIRIKIDADNEAVIEARVNGAMSRKFGAHLIVRAGKERGALVPLESIAFEDYVAGVVATEASQETEIEALRAQAIVVRSYAIASLESLGGKHANEGFSFCSSTHCERYTGRFSHDLAGRATEETRGQVLAVGEREPRLLRALFHACCGGHTTDARELWPGSSNQPGTVGASDQACAAPDHRSWARTFKSRDVFSALEKDRRLWQEKEEESIPSSIRSISVEQGQASDVRATRIRIEDEHGRVSLMHSANFTVAIGRSLGWNACPSPPLNIRKEGEQIIISGRGFGHGAGLCQHGAHEMALGGKTSKDIIAHFFPGARILRVGDIKDLNINNPQSAIQNQQSDSLQHNDGHAVVEYTTPNSREDVREVTELIEQARKELGHFLSFKDASPLRVRIHSTTADFIAAANVSGEMAGASKDGVIHLQPVQLLKKRGILRSTIRHEYAHYAISTAGGARVARWFQEGMAVRFAGEAGELARYRDGNREISSLRELECALERAKSIKERRSLYSAAHAQVVRMIEREGESKIWRDLQNGRFVITGC
jgi:stage II sporulation protein D